ncbi:hypothetical protein BH18ACT17_BH18ACT17_13600 [soil metagenome]
MSADDPDIAAPLDPPVWYEPLRAPSWLVPGIRDDAATIVYSAEAWQEPSVDPARSDLRLGLPLYLAEAARFGTNTRPIALRTALAPGDRVPDARFMMRSAVAPGSDASIRVRVHDAHDDVIGEVVRQAKDERSLGEALEALPHAVSEITPKEDVRRTWSSAYILPSGPALTAYVRGQRACLRLRDGVLPSAADPDAIAERRAAVRLVLGGLGSLATSTSEPFPALLFFGALLAAHDAESPVVGEFRLQANARCTTATDPRDPVYAMAALVMRLFGDLDASERRMKALRATSDESMQTWLERVKAVT